MEPPSRTLSGTRRGGPVVLVVDANDEVREKLAAYLAQSGFCVVEAEDASGAIDSVFRFGPKALVLALELPGIDGLKVLRRLRMDERTADLSIIATGDAVRQEPLAVAAGADAFLLMPFEPARLVATLVTILAARAESRANEA
jgi:DNA-binding response OmpR family regulator